MAREIEVDRYWIELENSDLGWTCKDFGWNLKHDCRNLSFTFTEEY